MTPGDWNCRVKFWRSAASHSSNLSPAVAGGAVRRQRIDFEGERIMAALLNAIAPVALVIFVVGVGVRLHRWVWAATRPRLVAGVTRRFEGGPDQQGVVESLRAVIIDPIRMFYTKSNCTWGRGYVLYHIAITTKVIGYSLAGLILLFHIVVGNAVPDVATHAAASANFTPANLLAIVFGNAEHLQAEFLFGSLAPFWVVWTGIAVLCAVAGNLHMLYTAIRGRTGAITGDIDPAARRLRTKGQFKWDRLAIRLIILTIIWTELLARLGLVPGVVFLHAFLGLTLLTLLPFTYLFHMVYNFLALFYATRRRMARTIA
jgi:nitrate reductase gamma subunit